MYYHCPARVCSFGSHAAISAFTRGGTGALYCPRGGTGALYCIALHRTCSCPRHIACLCVLSAVAAVNLKVRPVCCCGAPCKHHGFMDGGLQAVDDHWTLTASPLQPPWWPRRCGSTSQECHTQDRTACKPSCVVVVMACKLRVSRYGFPVCDVRIEHKPTIYHPASRQSNCRSLRA
jgi:hypothetical protein